MGAEPNSLKIDVDISGNTLRNAGTNPILLRQFDGAEVSDNKVLGSTGHAILILGLPTVQGKNLTVADNQVRGAAMDGMKVQYVDDVDVAVRQIVAPVNHGIEVLNCNRTSLVGISVRNPAFSGVFISGGTVHSVDGAKISGGISGAYDGVRVSGTSDVSITGGYLASGRWAVFTSTTDYVVTTGVNAHGAVSAGKISCDATTKVVANNIVT